MVQILNDNVQTTLTIDEQPWLLSEAEVELSRISTPNYVVFIATPDPTIEESLPEENANFSQLVGAPFSLSADNQLISERDTNAEEDSLLFKGNLANISPMGDRVFEGIAYDPSQQGFTGLTDESGPPTGSVLNQTIDIPQPSESYQDTFSDISGTKHPAAVVPASKLLERVAIDKFSLDPEKVIIELEDGGVTIEGAEGEYTGAFASLIAIQEAEPTVRTVLERLRQQTESEWWFDKRGNFHFGVPKPTRHNLQLITDTDAGKTTPPYQSVKVIGSGSASQEGYERNSMEMEDGIVVQRKLVSDNAGDVTVDKVFREDEIPQPQFTYRNAEISTLEQAKRTANKLLTDIAEQQSDGKVTVVGFPEIIPLDGINMPQAEDEKQRNYNPRQPMGGGSYGVYKVVHRLNPSDGFITILHVSGVVGPTRTVVAGADARPSTKVTSSATTQDQIK